MKVPRLTGLIDRRMLVNYTADPDTVQKLLPAPFRPKTFQGQAGVGIFDDETWFPKGSIWFDNALLMTKIDHKWESISNLNYCP